MAAQYYPWGARGNSSDGAGVDGPTAPEQTRVPNPCKFGNYIFTEEPEEPREPVPFTIYTLTDCDTEDVFYTDEQKTPGIGDEVGNVVQFEETGDSCFTVGIYTTPEPPEEPEDPPTYDERADMEGPRYVWVEQSGLSYTSKNFIKAAGGFLVVMQGNSLGQISDVTFTDCWFKNAKGSAAYTDCSGGYFYYVTNLNFVDCVIENNGWYNGLRYYRNHGIYLNRCHNVTFTRCQFIGNSAQGCKVLGCTNVDFIDCEFEDNLIGIGIDSREYTYNLTALRCSFTNTGGRQNPPSSGAPIAWAVAVGLVQGVDITDCVWDGPNPEGASNAYGVNIEYLPSTDVVLTRPDFTSWTATKWLNRIGSEFSVVNEAT